MPGGRFNTRDYYALQVGWVRCRDMYLEAIKFDNRELQVRIIDAWRDSLVDVSEGKRALRSNYEDWENNEWKVLCNNRFDKWTESDPFEATNPQSVRDESERIAQELNPLRYRKILEIIQNSGIGLGTKSGLGYYVGPKDKEKFTGTS